MENTKRDEMVLTVTEVAGQLRIGRAAAYALVHSGQLKAVRVNRRILVPSTALQEFLQAAGRVADGEMHQVFNMGIGFAFVVPESAVAACLEAARFDGKAASVIGRVVKDPAKRCAIVKPSLRGALVALKAKGEFSHEASLPAEMRA